MALLNILQFPDPLLKKVGQPVDVFDQEIMQLAKDMLETMYETQGVGLAAIQVNVAKQLIVMDVSNTRNQPLCIINPEIIERRGTTESEEGCLSFPGVYAKVERAKEVDLRYYDQVGRLQSITATGLFAICIQHEMDHLNGITFYDHLSSVKQMMLRKKLDKLRRKAL